MGIQSLMVARAKEELEQELEEKEEQKAKYLEEKSPPIQTSGMSLAELQVHICKLKRCKFFVYLNNIANTHSRGEKIYIQLILFSAQALCEELHAKIDVVDEERYDIEAKVLHNNREVSAALITYTTATQVTHISQLRQHTDQFNKYRVSKHQSYYNWTLNLSTFSADQRPEYQSPGPAREV